jgi:hypothetical protein
MTQGKILANRVREVFINGTFIAYTNYTKLLKDISWQEANQKILDFNTIALLTFHMNYYLDGVNNVFRGGGLDIRDKYAFDMPPIQNEVDWQNLKSSLFQNAEAFAGFVENMSDEKINGNFIDEKYGTYLRNIDAMIEHGYYHMGQISLISKAIRSI